jgi:hypothetical protein
LMPCASFGPATLPRRHTCSFFCNSKAITNQWRVLSGI